MNEAIEIKYDYVIVDGNGKNETIFRHSSSSESLIVCTNWCNLTLSNLSYSINASSSIIVQNGGFLRFESVHFQNDVSLHFVIESNAIVRFLDCSFVSSTVHWQISNGANAHFDDCLFDDLTNGNNENSLLQIADNSNVSVINCEFSHIQSELIWKSLDSNGTILQTSNDCEGICIEHMNGDLFIDYESAYNKSVKFKLNTSASSVLHGYYFEPKTIYEDIDFVNFDYANGRIIFEQCNRFNSEYVKQTLFEQSSIEIVTNNSFNQSSDLFKEQFLCNQSDICYVKCFHDTLVCSQSTFISSESNFALFLCDSESSCHESKINVSNAENVSILCNEITACSEMEITATNISDFVLECVKDKSCKDMTVNVTQTNNAQIHCYNKHSCDGLRVHSDKNEIKINIHSISNDIIINVPSNYSKESLECNPKNAYLRLDGITFNEHKSLEQAALNLFDGNMPCEDVKFSFHSSQKVDCQIQYEPISNYVIEERLTHLTDEMECFPPIYISNLTDYDCFGTDAPTQSPTAAPTDDCPSISVNVNDRFANFAWRFDGLYTRVTEQNETPLWKVPQFEHDKFLEYGFNETWRIHGEKTTHYLEVQDRYFLQQLDGNDRNWLWEYSGDTQKYSVIIKCIGSVSPTNAPSYSPTRSPTTSPTNNPTVDPTADPTLNPTADPTVEPTVEPTNQPTSDPTNAPSNSPSNAPSLAPTAPPSRAPTSLADYDSFINVNYSIGRMDWNEVTLLTEVNGVYKFNQSINVDIVNMIESAYVSMDWTLHFHEFFVQIKLVNGFNVQSLSKKKRPDIPLTDDCWQKENSCKLTLKSKLFCDQTICDYIFDKFPEQQRGFETLMTVHLFDYLYPNENMSASDSKMYFAVDDMDEPRLINEIFDIEEWFKKIENWIFIFVAFMLIVVIVMLFFFKHRIKKMRNKKAFIVSNPMVLLVSIGDYDPDIDNVQRNEINVHIDDLPGIAKDTLHMNELFGERFGYDVYPKVDKNGSVRIGWNERDFKEFIEERARYLVDNVKSGKKYDSLVLIISCHGIPDYLLMSDYRKYSKLAVQRTFSFWSELREIPRFILFDCCSGHQVREITSEVNVGHNEKGCAQQKVVEEKHIFDGTENHKMWVDDDYNPDHLLAKVNAANAGFTSNLSPVTGSYLIYKMFNKYMDALDGKRSPFPFIHEVFDEIQAELQNEGTQLPESVWNDGTRYLMFRKRSAVKNNLPSSSTKMEFQIHAQEKESNDDDEVDIVYEKDDDNVQKGQMTVETETEMVQLD